MTKLYKDDWEQVKAKIETQLKNSLVQVIANKAILEQVEKQIKNAESRPQPPAEPLMCQ